jgi:hypothetical protein
MARTPMRLTSCPECGVQIGVQPNWNRSIHSTHSSTGFKVGHHRDEVTNLRCLGAYTIVSADTVWENPSYRKRQVPAP